MKLPIRIMSHDFDLIAEVDEYDSLQIERSWYGIGVMELRINRHLRGANELKRGRILYPHNQTHKAYVIRHREIELDERGKITENWIIRALSLKSWLSDKATIPPAGKAQDTQRGNAESVMRHYVDANVINPSDSDNKLDDLVQSDNLDRGEHIEWQSRYKVLSDVLADIGNISGLGWNIRADLNEKKYIFDVLKGRNLTADQTEYPPAIFSPEFGTLGQLAYTESELNYKNYAIVAGQGEGADRRIVEVGDADATGYDRRVLFVDARDISEETDDDEPQPRPEEDIIADLENRGRQKLAEHNQEIYMEGQALMGRVENRIPTSTEGTLPNATVERDELETLFLSAFQPVEDTVTVIRDFEIRLTQLGHYENSEFTWSENTPDGTNITVKWSTDGRNWRQLTNGGGIDLDVHTPLSRLYIRYELTTTDHDVVPSLNNFEYDIGGYTTKEVISTARLLYGRDYDLGDMVTLQNKDWGITMDARITAVKEVYEAGRSPRIELTFGNDRPTLIDKIKQEMSGMITEITR